MCACVCTRERDPHLLAATEITPAADIYAFGLCMLEVRAGV